MPEVLRIFSQINKDQILLYHCLSFIEAEKQTSQTTSQVNTDTVGP